MILCEGNPPITHGFLSQRTSNAERISILWRHYGRSPHYNDVTMSSIASQITSLTIVYSTGLFGCRSKNTSKLRVTGLCAGNSPGTGELPHKWPVTRKMFPFDDVIMQQPFPGLGVTESPFVNFSVSKSLILWKVILTTFIFDRCHRSWTAAKPVKYNRDIQ